ncbi:MAG: lysostaphin resistance A-like protein [Chloroflexota bacterium]
MRNARDGSWIDAIGRRFWIYALYLIALIVAEAMTTLVDPSAGLILEGAILIALVFHSALIWGRPGHRLLLALTLAPLIRLLSLGLPLGGFPVVDWYLIVSVPLFVGAAMLASALGYSWSDVGLRAPNPIGSPSRAMASPARRALWDAFPFLAQLLVAATGPALGYAEYWILQPAPVVDGLTWERLWAPVLIVVVSTGLLEEVLFRGLIQRAAVEVMGRPGVVYAALIYAAFHLGYRSSLDLIFVLGVGLFFGLVVAKTGSLLGVTLSHGLANLTLLIVLPLLPLLVYP